MKMSLTSARWSRTRSDEKPFYWRGTIVDLVDDSRLQKKVPATAGSVTGQRRYRGRETGKRMG
jgi:hypothetical protein